MWHPNVASSAETVAGDKSYQYTIILLVWSGFNAILKVFTLSRYPQQGKASLEAIDGYTIQGQMPCDNSPNLGEVRLHCSSHPMVLVVASLYLKGLSAYQ